MTFALEKGWLTVALALMVPGIAWVAAQRPLPMLRWLAAAIAALVLARIGWEPRIVGDDVGTTPIFNWLLYGYGVPALAFWVGGHLLRQRADDAPARAVDAAAILFSVLLAFLEIRHFMNDGDVFAQSSGLAELALQVSVGLAMAIGLERLRGRTRSIIHDAGALIIAGLALAGIVFGLMLAENPLLTGEPVGGAFFNLILLGYGLPAALAIMLALIARTTRPMPYRATAAAVSVGLALLYLSLEVTRALSRPGADRGSDDRCRAIHLLGGLARFRRRAAAGRNRAVVEARSPRLGRGRAAHHRQGVSGRHGRPHRRVAGPVVHRTRTGAGRDRLPLSAPALSAASTCPPPERRAGWARRCGLVKRRQVVK